MLVSQDSGGKICYITQRMQYTISLGGSALDVKRSGSFALSRSSASFFMEDEPAEISVSKAR